MQFRWSAKIVFLSYSRTDSAFVDRLDAALVARRLRPWVDRKGLEGGQDWLDKIQQAIRGSSALVVVLSPEAVASEYVRMEYREALRLGKTVIPILHRPVTDVPIDLHHIEWITSFETDFERGLNELVLALSGARISQKPPRQATGFWKRLSLAHSVPQTQSLNQEERFTAKELYLAAKSALERGDLEQAAILLENVQLRDPGFLADSIQQQLDEIMPSVLASRIDRLREEAEQAGAVGDWNREIRAWHGMLEIAPDSEEANERLTNAQHNRTQDEYYDIVKDLALRGDIRVASDELRQLWARAPLYGDPAGLAPKLGLTAPPSWSELRHAERVEQIAAAEEERRREAISHTRLLNQFRKQARMHYRKGKLHASWLTTWTSGLILLTIVDISINELLNAVPFSELGFAFGWLLPYLAVFCSSVVLYGAGYWRALHWTTYGLAILGAILPAFVISHVLHFSRPMGANVVVSVFHHYQIPPGTNSTGIVFALIWAVMLGLLSGAIFIELGPGDLAVMLVCAVVGGVYGYCSGYLLALLGPVQSGVVIGVGVGILMYVIAVIAGYHVDIALITVVYLVSLLFVGNLIVWPLILGLTVIAAIQWSVALIFGLMAGLSAGITIRVCVTRRESTENLVAAYEAKLREEAEREARIRAASAQASLRRQQVWASMRRPWTMLRGQATLRSMDQDNRKARITFVTHEDAPSARKRANRSTDRSTRNSKLI